MKRYLPIVALLFLVGAVSTMAVDRLNVGTLQVSSTSNLAIATASSLTFSGTGTPSLTLCNASPPTAVTNAGSLCIDVTAQKLYQTTGAGAWTQVGASTGNTAWTLLGSDTLTGLSLANYNQRKCTWTATASGFQVDDGGSECFLSIETLNGYSPAPGAACGTGGGPCLTYAMHVEMQYTVGSVSRVDGGFCARCGVGPVSTGAVRAFMSNSIGGFESIGYDVFGAGGTQIAISGSPVPQGVWHTLDLMMWNMNVANTGVIQWHVDGNPYQQAVLSSMGSTTGIREGIWCNPGHCLFRNLKIYLPAYAQ